MTQLRLLNSLTDTEQIRKIFFLTSSRKNFTSAEDKEKFFNTWMSYYLSKCTDEFFVAENNNKIFAYLTGCSDSKRAIDYYGKDTPYFLFSDLFSKFPAHLHINAHPSSQGTGIGSKLISHYKKFLIDRGISGLHIITSPTARNTGFYTKNNFIYKEERSWKSTPSSFYGLFSLSIKKYKFPLTAVL